LDLGDDAIEVEMEKLQNY